MAAIISMDDLDTYASTPLYRQLAKAIRDKIVAGELAPGDRLPTEQSLNSDLGLSISTVRNAYAALVKEGLVTRRAGKGSFVAVPTFNRGLGGLYNFTSEIENLCKTPETKILSFETIEAMGPAAEALGLGVGDRTYRIERLRSCNDEALLLETSYIPETLCPGLVAPDVEGSLYEALERRTGINPGSAYEVHAAVVLGKAEARKLGRKAGTAAFRILRTTTSTDGTVFEYSEAYAPGDSTRYVMRLEKESISVSKHYDA